MPPLACDRAVRKRSREETVEAMMPFSQNGEQPSRLFRSSGFQPERDCARAYPAGWKPALRDRPEARPPIYLTGIGFFLVSVLACHAEFYDPMVNDRTKLFAYLESVEEAVGSEAFESVPYERALQLAKTMGPIDRQSMAPGTFVGNLRQLGAVEKRFYRGKPLSEDEVMAFLMPKRIRYEATSRPEWPERLGQLFKDGVGASKAADECARHVFKWIASNLVLTGSKSAYRLPMRGDLDPLTVLKGGRGSEIDLSIFCVAALRSCGVAARLAWAPTLRGEVGGKVWLEYRSENGNWIPWVPSYGDSRDHLDKIRQDFGSKIALVMAAPDSPLEITSSYVETVSIRVRVDEDGTQVAFMIVGADGLLPLRGIAMEYARNEREAQIGRGPLIVASASSNHRSYALLPIEMPATNREILILSEGGGLAVDPASETHPKTTANP
jgi:hypothetical protein